ncbi:MAG: alpha amylase C-terminal domain-containing protein [Alistipes sp.]|nr:alpha amylase C-terminal domain-containing protein [Alistipes sp.]MBQ6940591.1 alpha amylase C-terminal domain-containing protein [Alistipes sp.]
MMYKNPEWSYSAVLYEMNIRQLTAEGTLRAATERLPFLRSVGVDAIWLMPIYPIGVEGRKGRLGSYYSIRDYKGVNPEFGTADDLRHFITTAHALGLKVLLDWVANHTARDARWITERPSEWYERDEAGVAKVPWDWSDTAKLNYANHDVWRGQIEAMRYWVEEFGVDGFRCDMAMLVPIEFWQEASAELHRIKPDVFMLAEAEEDNLFDSAFNASYQWNIHHIMCDIAKGARRVWDLRNAIQSERAKYPREAMRMSFTSNHDENSWSGSHQARFGAALDVMTAMTFLMPSTMPLIYTGQEVGYDHSFEFFERDAIPAECYVENRSTELYRRLSALKHRELALAAGERGGEVVEIENNAKDCMMTFVREVRGSRVVAIVNLSPYTIHADFRTGIYAGKYIDALSGERVVLQDHVERDIAPWQYQILVK